MQETAAPHPGVVVRRARAELGMSLRELARRIEVSPATLSAIETGLTRISLERLWQVAAALDLPASTFLPADASPSATKPQLDPMAADLDTGDWRDFAPLPIDAILASAIRVFVRMGYHGASVRAIAQQAGLSVPGVYHHYPSKQDLLVKVLDITMTDLVWRLERVREESAGADSAARLALFVEALALFHARRNDLAFIGASEMRSLEPDSHRRIARLRQHVQLMLDEDIDAVVAGGARVENPRDAGKAIATMCTSLAQWFDPEGSTTPEQIAREYAAFALALVGSGSPELQ
jgi:AcrR family transcriptional regulator/DNA-binding XRE family transcriptional regulator